MVCGSGHAGGDCAMALSLEGDGRILVTFLMLAAALFIFAKLALEVM
jgi:hypothetical protein